MLSLLLRVFFNALAFMYILPAVSSVSFVGAFWPEAVIVGFMFAIVSFIIGKIIKTFVFGTLGLGMILIFFIWWLIPAVQIMITAAWLPDFLIVPGWGTAIWAGLIFMVINSLFHFFVESEKRG